MIPGLELLLAQCAPQVAPSTMMAIMKVESAGNPWALNVNGRRLPRQPQSRDEAVNWAERLVSGGFSVDMGLMQVNSGNLARLQLSAAQLFDPCTNLAAGAKILAEFYGGAARRYGDEQTALRAALSAYNTGNHQNGFRNGYVGKVTAAAYRPLAGKTAVGMGSNADDTENFATQARSVQRGGEPVQPLVFWVRRPSAGH